MTTKVHYIPGVTAKTLYNGTTIDTAVIGGGSESMEGSTHDLRGLGQRDVGGPCRLIRAYTNYTTIKATGSQYTGSDVYPLIYGMGAGSNLTDTQINANGTTGIARSMPTNPVFSAATALGELHRDGIPNVIGMNTWKDRTRENLKGKKLPAKHSSDVELSDEFLNYKFGWVPLVNDVRNFAYSVKNHRDILRDFREGSGKNTRVSYNFGTTWRSEGYFRAVGLRSTTGLSMGTPWGSVSSVEESRAWFRGCFTYHLPVGDAAYNKAMRFGTYADKLLGVRLTPEVLWNLTPWSWGVDWFTNTGDIIHNFSQMGHDGLVLKYGYSMHRRYYRSVSSVNGAKADSRNDSLIRLPSSPYFGFGATGALSATQSAILIALGITHFR